MLSMIKFNQSDAPLRVQVLVDYLMGGGVQEWPADYVKSQEARGGRGFKKAKKISLF